MKKLPILLSLMALALSFQNAAAQQDDLPGYVVLVSGDTLHGFLKAEGADRLLDQVQFKSSAATDYKTYKPSEARSFQFDNGNLYRAVTFSNVSLDHPVYETHYAKLLVTGEYDLYSFMEKGDLYFVARHDTTYRLIYDDDLHTIPYVKGNFRNELNYFAVFCDASKFGIENILFSEDQVVSFFRKLDACMEPGKTVATYYHKAKAKPGFFAYVGGMDLGSQRSQFTAEARFKLVYPQINPDLSINIGVRYASVEKKLVNPSYLAATIYYQETYSIKSIPLTFQYNLTHGIVQPFIYAGLSACSVDFSSSVYIDHSGDPYYHSVDIEWLAGAGVEVKLADFLRARAEWRYEYITQWPTIGLAVNF